MNDYYQLLYGTKQMVDAQNNDCFDKLLKDLRMWLSPQQSIFDNCICHGEEVINDCNIRDYYFADRETPIVVLLGPPAVGKTMTMARLMRYLQENGYSTVLDRFFYNDNHSIYEYCLDTFQAVVNNGEQAPGTSLCGAFLVNVYEKGKKIIQVLDVAGEEFFGYTSRSYVSRTINAAFANKNVKIPVFFFEPNMSSRDRRDAYVEAIHRFALIKCRNKDRSILLYNKVDILEADNLQYPSKSLLFENFKEQFPNIMYCFRNNSKIKRVFKPYTALFVPFCTGRYNYNQSCKTIYTPGNSKYPEDLWKTICSIISKTR